MSPAPQTIQQFALLTLGDKVDSSFPVVVAQSDLPRNPGNSFRLGLTDSLTS